MKRMAMFFLICILTGYSCMVCSAGNDTLEEEKQTTFGFYATYIAGETDYFTAPVENGESRISLPDKTVITVDGIPEDGLTLVVYPVTDHDKDAWEWFSACMKGKGSNIVPYEIYFLKKDGTRLLADGVTVGILLPESMETPAVFSLNKDATVTELASETANGKIIFQADGRYYYVLAESTGTVTPDTPSPTPAPGETAAPKSGADGNSQGTGAENGETDGTGTATQGVGARTGDETNAAFWLFVFISSAAVSIAGMIFCRKRAS
ncbi:MAG: hypothetical protein Q4C58_00985 [Eubacteriales bacterium]|nr:hypothetical protein [Eubacteriales bacterium]